MSMKGGIRVMLVDDHPVVVRGLREELEDWDGFEVVGEAADGVEALSLAQETRPDVIVMDVMMPRKDGVDACRDILDLLPDTKVLMLTASTEDEAVIEAIAAGATGFVYKYSGGGELVDAVLRVSRGEVAIPDDVLRRTFRLIQRRTAMMPSSKLLTAREREILTHFAMGKSYAKIGQDLGVNMETARNAIYRVQDKLGLESKQEIVVWAVRHRLLDGEEAQPS